MNDIPHTVIEETDSVKICVTEIGCISQCCASFTQAVVTHIDKVVISSIYRPHDACEDKREDSEDDEVNSVRSHGISFASSFEYTIVIYL